MPSKTDIVELDFDPENSPMVRALHQLVSGKEAEVKHLWAEDDFEPILPEDYRFMRQYGYKLWKDWLEIGRPRSFCIVTRTDPVADDQ